MDLTNHQKKIKILLLGDNYVGKSSIIIRYTKGLFLEWTMPTPQIELIETHYHEVEPGEKVELQLWEVGHGEFWSSTHSFLPMADGFLLVFDLGNKTSFENAEHLHKEMCAALPSKTFLFVLVGNKCDRSEQQVNRDMAESLADKIGAPYIEISAKTGHNVAKIFELLTRRIYQASTQKDENKCCLS